MQSATFLTFARHLATASALPGFSATNMLGRVDQGYLEICGVSRWIAEPVSKAPALRILSPWASDDPDTIGARLVAAIIGDDIE
jgi:hypothetical protein